MAKKIESGGIKARRRTVAFIYGGQHPPLTQRGAMQWGMAHGWDIIDLTQWKDEIPEGVKPDGLIAHLNLHYRQFVEKFYPRVPVGVLIDRAEPADGPYAYVQRDTAMAGDTAANYFLERGFKNYAICHYGEPTLAGSITEFKGRVEGAGCTCFSIVCRGGKSGGIAGQAEVMKRQLSRLPMPTAIFCTNDRLARRTCRWCLEIGLSIPEQVAILGLGNDSAACEFGPVPLSSIDLMPEQRGIEAARLLQRMMDGEPTPTDPLRVPVGGVITRRSTDILAVPDPAVAHALRYIWDHYRENVGMDQIAMACGISRSKLSRHFKAALGRTVVDEMTRRRLQEACELLTTGDALIADVAAFSGYRSPQYFNEQFKKAYGMPPLEYRRCERRARRLVDE